MTRRYRHRYTAGRTFGKKGWKPPFPISANVDPRSFKCPLPQSDAEFAVLSQIFFGVPLHLGKLWVNDWGTGQAEIAEPYDSFATKDGFFTSYEGEGYDRLRWFMRTVFGPMNCSASLTYTDFKRYRHRHWLRLLAWQDSRRRGQSSSLRPAFVRLARSIGAGENISDRNRPPEGGVLTCGRVDGAQAASVKDHWS